MHSIQLAAITDEFSPQLPIAIAAMRELHITKGELRIVDGKNILDLSDGELQAAKQMLEDAGIEVISIASPLLKCFLPGAPELDRRFQQDAFASKHTFADQERLAQRAFFVARFFGAPTVRVFSYWRTVEPARCFDAVVESLHKLADAAGDLTVALENEHACNVATARECLPVLQAVPTVKLVWDPANALVAGETPFPDGYRLLPMSRIAHVHAKDCSMEEDKPLWTAIGAGQVRWTEQIEALSSDGYCGAVSLETHWMGPCGDKLEGSRICAERLRSLLTRHRDRAVSPGADSL